MVVLDDANHRKRNVGMKSHIDLKMRPGGQGVVRFNDVRVRELE